jgi:capsular polysaccharide biosynthesis protein
MKIRYWDESTTGDIQLVSKKRNIKVGYFRDCVVDGISEHYPLPLIKTRSELLLPTIERFMSLGRGTIYEEKMEWECKNFSTTKIETTPVFYFVYNCANYFHWIYDTIPYLYTFLEEKKKIKNLKLLVSTPEGEKDLYPFVYESLSLLGIQKEDLVFLDFNTKYDLVLIGSSLTHNRMSLEPPHPELFSIINSMEFTPSKKERIYISRRTWTRPKSDNIGTDYTKQRMCVNEDEVVFLFEKYGFKEVFCEDYSMKEKIGLFKSAKFVAGPIGGGMSNIIFCNADTNVLLINSPEFFKINKRLEYALEHTNLYHFNQTQFVERKQEIITGKSALSISGGMNSPWKVDIKSLQQKIISILD